MRKVVAIIQKYKQLLTAISFTFIALGIFLGIFGEQMIKNSFLIFATVIAGIPIFIKAYQALRMKVFSIELLVTIAITGALFIQEFIESSVVAFLFLFGDYLEARTLERTRSSLRELMDMAPQEAHVIRNGTTMKIPVEEVAVGERVLIHSGGKIPVDGKIITGSASINEATVTGESIPAAKKVNDDVFSGTIVDQGYIEMIAEKVGDDTTFAKIIELVEEAQDSKSQTEKFLNKFSHIYTPAVVVLSAIVYILLQDLHMAITFLVIACPGALVIGAPVSNVTGIGNGAKHGVLIKGGEVMDRLSKVDTVVFDKTGTLTKGKPEVTAMKVWDPQFQEDELLQIIAKAELISEHHLGKTIVKEAISRNLLINEHVGNGEIIKGKGIKVVVEGWEVSIGNESLMREEDIILNEAMLLYKEGQEKKGNTVVFTAINGKIAGTISIADQVREDAYMALQKMRNDGIKQMIMLTGDNRHTAALVARKLNLDSFHAELLPEDKVNYIKQLKHAGHTVAMAGDGINDAPAIATADIGLAMGDGGTDISMETADVVLMADKLTQFSHAYALAKATIRNMKQNTWIAIGTVFLLLLGVLNGSVHLASGMFIHEASVLLVILNGMRLIRFKSGMSQLKKQATKFQLQR
ncbi:cation-translocating P-type ATPase [Virgibacillus pantothenticus]|uniref:heavy metal translocating P-type ATPase n=1 Tax=Virgibacillus pantothenticus TaxID=1473 RepID=UPI001C21FBB7|nr:cation-translocating P-type ATPase [Virgibacillus pantothenticus]MBU8568190.1 cation-translocating P-type ATPase [Virgibacillus pantothenticus]MBU8601884.1 cation-translocating P-type ATPase [Virgibacillus pantothenticus]MBU8636023.1 cation-translocating P-type ATPase [Virgibacillus pantothenticus]MBU8644102.1 cation-translocating P-type ATPase [Virgibacillus pantothenticus]MBU8647946.1 cation-translocating P-type ATPase [Virgibacillus pantothenticus]